MAEDRKGTSLVRLAVGAGIIAAGAVARPCSCRAAAGRRPRPRCVPPSNPPIAAAIAAWAAGLWADVTAPTPPMFDDMRPFDEF